MSIPLKILIADDHPIFRRGLCEVIESDPGLQMVGQAGNGEEALRLIQELRPDIAILDERMPKLTGLEVVRALAGKNSATRMVLLTMHEDEELLAAIRAVAAERTFISPTLSGLLALRHRRHESLRQEKPGLEQLTPAERRILKHIADDRTSKEIAELLGCAVRTVETHRQNASNKLGLSGSHSLLKFAYCNRSRL